MQKLMIYPEILQTTVTLSGTEGTVYPTAYSSFILSLMEEPRRQLFVLCLCWFQSFVGSIFHFRCDLILPIFHTSTNNLAISTAELILKVDAKPISYYSSPQPQYRVPQITSYI